MHRILEDAMTKILKVKNVKDYSSWLGHTDSHLLVSIINYEKVSPVRHTLNDYSVYGIFFMTRQNLTCHTDVVSMTTRKEPLFVWLPDKLVAKRG